MTSNSVQAQPNIPHNKENEKKISGAESKHGITQNQACKNEIACIQHKNNVVPESVQKESDWTVK